MTSITIRDDVKQEHEALKPESLTWNDYMRIVAQSIDPDRFTELVEAFYQAQYGDAVERARERYGKAREDPSHLLSAEEARRRVREAKGDA